MDLIPTLDTVYYGIIIYVEQIIKDEFSIILESIWVFEFAQNLLFLLSIRNSVLFQKRRDQNKQKTTNRVLCL